MQLFKDGSVELDIDNYTINGVASLNWEADIDLLLEGVRFAELSDAAICSVLLEFIEDEFGVELSYPEYGI